MVTSIPLTKSNSYTLPSAQHALMTENGDSKSNILFICRSYLNVKNGSSDIAVLEQWFDQRLAKREAVAIDAFIAELETSIKGTPDGNERPAKSAKNEKSEKLFSFLGDLERKHFA